MKITDPGVIKNGEKDLIESLKEDLDLDAVKEIIKHKMTGAALSARGGEIVVYNNQIAFRLDFDLSLSGSLMFDRQGNHIPAESDGSDDQKDYPDEKEDKDIADIERDNKSEPQAKDALDLQDYDLDPLDDLEELTEDPEPELELKEDDPLIEDDTLTMDDLADDDITDILKESRDFWEKKKDS